MRRRQQVSLSPAAATAEALSELTGEEFDRACMEAQVELHQTALDTLDDVLIPEADDDDLRAELQQMRSAVIAHLELAQEIEADLP